MQLKLTRSNLSVEIDVEDLDKILSHTSRWYLSKKNGNIQGVIGKSKLLGKTIHISTAILGEFKGMQIDHINRNPLDNQKHNLRLATRSQNQYNKGTHQGRKYKGIYLHHNKKKWCVHFNYTDMGKRKVYSKYGFDTDRQAALHANEMYRKYHGEFAYQNVIEDKEAK
jgi:hypothetical protein